MLVSCFHGNQIVAPLKYLRTVLWKDQAQSTSRTWLNLSSQPVNSALHLSIGLLLPHCEGHLATQQNHDCLLSWLPNGGMSSPPTSGQQNRHWMTHLLWPHLGCTNVILAFLGLYHHGWMHLLSLWIKMLSVLMEYWESLITTIGQFQQSQQLSTSWTCEYGAEFASILGRQMVGTLTRDDTTDTLYVSSVFWCQQKDFS